MGTKANAPLESQRNVEDNGLQKLRLERKLAKRLEAETKGNDFPRRSFEIKKQSKVVTFQVHAMRPIIGLLAKSRSLWQASLQQ